MTSYRIYREDSDGCSEYLFSRDSEWEAADAIDELSKGNTTYHWYEDDDE